MYLGTETDAASHGTAANDLFKTVKRTTADEQNVARVNRHHLAARVFATAFSWNIADRTFDELQKGLLNAFT